MNITRILDTKAGGLDLAEVAASTFVFVRASNTSVGSPFQSRSFLHR